MIWRWLRRGLLLATWSMTLLVCMYVAIELIGMPAPPAQESTAEDGMGFRTHRDGQHIVVLAGSPYALGYHNSRLLADLMLAQEETLIDTLLGFTKSTFVAVLVRQVSLLYLAGLDKHLTPAERQEILGLAHGSEDPFPFLGSRYGRIASYHAIHELSHRFAFDNPLMACSLLTVGKEHTENGHALLARNFDFEGGEVFDQDKVVLVVRPDTGYGFVSIAWAGMAGAVSGINEHGLVAIINAGAAADYQRVGAPTTLLLRRALEQARTVEEAVEVLASAPRFVADIIGLADASGRVAVLELSPTRHALREGTLLPATNHMETATFQDDPVNAERQTQTTTLARRARLQAIVDDHEGAYTVDDLLQIMRDRQAADGRPLPVGHRHSLDALIATHSVIFDATAKRVWVSRGPYTLGEYLGYDVHALLAAERPEDLSAAYLAPLPKDALLDEWVSIERGRMAWGEARAALKAGDTARAAAHLEKIRGSLRDHPTTLSLAAQIAEQNGAMADARRLYQQALSAPPEYSQDVSRWQQALKRLEPVE